MKASKTVTIYTTTSPLDQFEINNLLTLDLPVIGNIQMSITNIGLYLSLAAFLILILNVLPNFEKMVSNNWSISLESLYATIHSIVRKQINSRKGQIYFPFMFSLFIFILINNLIGMIPYSFATTSHIILTFAVSFTIVLGATILGFQKHSLEYFSLLVPAGCPLALLPLLVLIELISYLARNISLGLRLAANILSGHMLLNILAGFTYEIIDGGLPFALGLPFGLGLPFAWVLPFGLGLPLASIPLSFIQAFTGLEFGIAFIQAQVFVVLSCSYVKDGLDLH